MIRSLWRYTVALIAMSVSFILISCGSGDSTTAPDPQELYWSLQINSRMFNLYPGTADTAIVSVHALSYNGSPLTLTEPARFRFVANDKNVRIDQVSPQSAIIIPLGPKRGLRLLVEQPFGNITLSDTVYIDILPVPGTLPEIQNLRYAPVAGDSAKISVVLPAGQFDGSIPTKRIPADIFDGNNRIIAGVSLDYQSDDPKIATIDRGSGQITVVREGTVWMHARTYILGKILHDSVLFTVGKPLFLNQWVYVGETLQHHPILSWQSVRLGIGASVNWVNGTSAELSIIFDDTASIELTNSWTVYGPLGSATTGPCPSPTQNGINIENLKLPDDPGGLFKIWGCESTASRKFTQAGTYSYKLQPGGDRGTIIIERE